ncbi:hypothetical protein BT96DRAFT_1025126 [Gymnopus androsaceus JB14]|uniref:Uncharacterized protein n=1 Tax=Gymnopus androsaceus JB14 TaxID=1447944 RepID=A0A6A4GU48_9AGAR|nr:hypothetical protein BT96DRAFT_1025126 [Gymnopus androsaceus JB14]
MSTAANEPSNVLSQYLAYPFESDESFKKGLSDIVSLAAINGSSSVSEDVLRSMRVFYFNRTTGNALSIDEVQVYENSLSSSSNDIPTSETHNTIASEGTERVLSFAQIQALIEAGKFDEIPYNKKISGDLNSASPTNSTAPTRKKPWEVQDNPPTM